MKVLDLACETRHRFEGWFASEQDFNAQLSGGLVACPICGSQRIEKQVSAPRLNLGHSGRDGYSAARKPEAIPTEVPPSPESALHAAWLAIAARIVASTDDVGPRFADEARKIHYGEAQDRSIRGTATVAQTQALIEEGVSVLPFVLPDVLKGTLH